jgi:hypothetical protein
MPDPAGTAAWGTMTFCLPGARETFRPFQLFWHLDS